jgi:hypothetical protein
MRCLPTENRKEVEKVRDLDPGSAVLGPFPDSPTTARKPGKDTLGLRERTRTTEPVAE